jgi:hypothetical protein
MREWIPAIESRFYQPLGPIIILGSLFCFEKFKFKGIEKTGLVFILIFTVSIYSFTKYKLFSEVDTEKSKLELFLKDRNIEKNRFVFLTDGYWKNKLFRNGINNVYSFPVNFEGNFKVGSNTNVIVILSKYDYNSFGVRKVEIDKKLLKYLTTSSYIRFELSDKTILFYRKSP